MRFRQADYTAVAYNDDDDDDGCFLCEVAYGLRLPTSIFADKMPNRLTRIWRFSKAIVSENCYSAIWHFWRFETNLAVKNKTGNDL